MARGNRWIDQDWRRDWLFWTGVVVGALGFFRIVVRTYREP